MDEIKKIKVINRDSGTVGYKIPERGIRRVFQPGETKMIAEDELQALQYEPGGDYLLRHLLIVNDKEVLEKDLNIETEPEYFYTEEQIVDLLLNGDMDHFLDMLDFAPDGVIEIVKSKAVELKLPDSNKREAITKKTGFNIDNAINVNKIMSAEEESTPAPEKKERRVAAEEEKPQRRASKYNIVG